MTPKKPAKKRAKTYEPKLKTNLSFGQIIKIAATQPDSKKDKAKPE